MFRERYTEQARKALINAEDWAVKLNSPFISSEHILLGLLNLEESLAFQILERLGVNTRKPKSELEIKLREQAPSESPTISPTFTPSAKQVLIRAADEARSMRGTHITPLICSWVCFGVKKVSLRKFSPNTASDTKM